MRTGSQLLHATVRIRPLHIVTLQTPLAGPYLLVAPSHLAVVSVVQEAYFAVLHFFDDEGFQ